MDATTTYPLTIAYDAKRAFVNYRGLGNYCRNLFSQMAQYYGENRYVLCTPEDKGMYPWLSEAPFERVMPHGAWRMAPSLWRRYGIPYALKEKGVDIYHGLSQELPEGIERLGCKTVVTMHDAIFMRYPELYSATYRHSFIRRNASACRRADLLVAISEQTKRDYMTFFGVPAERIRVVYQGCNELFWHPVDGDQRQAARRRYSLPDAYVLSVGALEPRKNHIRIIEALADAHIGLPLVLVGKGNNAFKRLLNDTAARYGVSLHLIENVQTEDLPALYRMANVFAYPSLFEGFGIPVLEAARCEVPVVTSKGICFEEIAGEGAWYVNPNDASELGLALTQALDDNAQTQQRVAKALTNTEKFRAECIAKEWINVYQSLV